MIATIRVGPAPGAIVFDSIPLRTAQGAVLASIVGLVANAGDGTVTVFDPLTNEIKRTIRVGPRPSGIVVVTSPKNAAYVTNAGDGTVSIVDPVALTVTATVPAGAAPSGIAAPFDSHAWIADARGNSVSALQLDVNAIDATIPVGNAPSAISLGGLFWPAPSGCAGVAC